MLTLASRLRALDDATLRRTIDLRAVSATGIRDFFDLAEALLEPDAIQRVLAKLDRATLAVLAVAGESSQGTDAAPSLFDLAERLSALAGSPVDVAEVAGRAAELDALMLARLADGRFAPYSAVTTQLLSWPELGLPNALELASTPAPAALASVDNTDTRFTDRLAAERAFAAVSSIAELVTELAREPARELSRGGLGLPETKRLAAVMNVELEAVPSFVATASRAELTARSAGYWEAT
jgi:hypothetical protein